MSDRSPADASRQALRSLEAELGVALHERAAGVTTSTLLRPELPGAQQVPTRPPVPRWRIVGAVAAVSAVILAVVVGRAVMAPQQARTAAPGDATASSLVGPAPQGLEDRLWGATGVVMDDGTGTATIDPVGSRTMTAEFSGDGVAVFRDGNNVVRGRFVAGSEGIVVTGAGGWVPTSVSRTDTHLRETAALGALLDGMPEPVSLRMTVTDTALTLEHGHTTVRYRMLGVTPAVAVAAPERYPLGAAVGATWRAATVRIKGENRGVDDLTPVTVELGADGTFTIGLSGATLRGRWWATPAGLVTTGVSGEGSSSLDVPITTYQQEWDVIHGLLEVGTELGDGRVQVSFAAQGAQLVVTPISGSRIPVTFVQA